MSLTAPHHRRNMQRHWQQPQRIHTQLCHIKGDQVPLFNVSNVWIYLNQDCCILTAEMEQPTSCHKQACSMLRKANQLRNTTITIFFSPPNVVISLEAIYRNYSTVFGSSWIVTFCYILTESGQLFQSEGFCVYLISNTWNNGCLVHLLTLDIDFPSIGGCKSRVGGVDPEKWMVVWANIPVYQWCKQFIVCPIFLWQRNIPSYIVNHSIVLTDARIWIILLNEFL